MSKHASHKPLSENANLLKWVEKMIDLCKPDAVHWVDGSQAENEALVREHAKQGGFPADRVSQVQSVIDPATAELATRGWTADHSLEIPQGPVTTFTAPGGQRLAIYELARILAAKLRRQECFEQLVDPEAFYPVYGDSAEETKDVNTRGPLYVLIKADRSTLTVGKVQTCLQTIQFFRDFLDGKVVPLRNVFRTRICIQLARDKLAEDLDVLPA